MLIANECTRLCMRVVPSNLPEFQFEPIDEYDKYNFKFILYKHVSKLDTNDMDLRYAIDQITNYIKSSTFEEDYTINEKSGVIFFYNGYPLMGFANKIALILPKNYHYAVIIDINNFIFNRNIMTQLREKQKEQRKAREQLELFLTVIIIFVIYKIFLYLNEYYAYK